MVNNAIYNQSLYQGLCIIYTFKMANYRSKDNDTKAITEDENIYDTIQENFIRTVDEWAKIQPQYSQSISNLQLDFIQTIKNIIQNAISSHKQITGVWNYTASAPYLEHFTKQSNDITNNIIRTALINNQLTITAFDAARENLKIYNRTIETVTDYNNDIAKAWNSFFYMQQDYFNNMFRYL
jgi:hypothetical protein